MSTVASWSRPAVADPLDDAPWQPPTVDRPVATFMVVAAIVVFGWVSLQRTPVDLMPELSYPTITVRTDYPGAAPEEVEDAITRPIEELLGTVEGLVGMTSVSRAGGADVVFRFQWDTPLDDATQKVRERLSLVDLPDGASNPLILRYDPALDPILTLAVVGDVPPETLRRYVEDEVKGELERVRGVAMVRVSGGTDAVVRVDLIESRLASFGLDARAVGGQDALAPVVVVADRVRLHAVEPVVLGCRVDCAGVQVPVPDAGIGAFLGQVQARLALCQRRLGAPQFGLLCLQLELLCAQPVQKLGNLGGCGWRGAPRICS